MSHIFSMGPIFIYVSAATEDAGDANGLVIDAEH